MSPGRARLWLAVGAGLTASLTPAWVGTADEAGRAGPSGEVFAPAPESAAPSGGPRGAASPDGAGPDRGCAPGTLPSAQPRRGQRETAARALADCLTSAAPGRRTAESGGTTLRAATLSVTGLYCPPAADLCRASSIHLSRARIRHGRGEAASCLVAEEFSLTGTVLFRAAILRGRLLGVLPLTVSTRALPPVPVPFLRLDAVVAHGLWAKAGEAAGTAVTIGPGSGVCGDAAPDGAGPVPGDV
ncbi:hypothetical protein [Streptomyces sp. NPDC023327]|uniref:hypothetical protein n=2 Tax=unclassified Streptomyces TaxID=2593676 RepID=UPI0033D11AF0